MLGSNGHTGVDSSMWWNLHRRLFEQLVQNVYPPNASPIGSCQYGGHLELHILSITLKFLKIINCCDPPIIVLLSFFGFIFGNSHLHRESTKTTEYDTLGLIYFQILDIWWIVRLQDEARWLRRKKRRAQERRRSRNSWGAGVKIVHLSNRRSEVQRQRQRHRRLAKFIRKHLQPLPRYGHGVSPDVSTFKWWITSSFIRAGSRDWRDCPLKWWYGMGFGWAWID